MIRLVYDATETRQRELDMFGATEEQVRVAINNSVASFGSVQTRANLALGRMITQAEDLIELPGRLEKRDIPMNLRKAVQELHQVKLALYLASPIQLWMRGE